MGKKVVRGNKGVVVSKEYIWKSSQKQFLIGNNPNLHNNQKAEK